MTPAEKVARALAADRYGEDCADARWPEFVCPARAAITALMEPSEEMVGAGQDDFSRFGQMGNLRVSPPRAEHLKSTFTAMISKALE